MIQKARQASVAAALMLAIAITSGCAHRQAETNQPPPLPKHAATLAGVEEDYRQAEVQTEWTQDALHELVTSPYQDLQQAASTFRENVNRMLALGQNLVQHADGMHNQGETYLVEPAPLPPAPAVPACPVPAMQRVFYRPAQIGGYFDAISDDAWQIKHAYRAYQFDIESIVDALSRTTNPAMVAGVNVMVAKARVDSANLVDALEQAQGAIDEANAANQPAAAKKK